MTHLIESLGALRILRLAMVVACLSACSGLPPGSSYPKRASTALADPLETRLGKQLSASAEIHPGLSGFRILSVGVDGFLTRAQIIDSAEKTLDLQYYIFRSDETGRLLSAALVRAAERGVHIRLLLDDGETKSGDTRVAALGSIPGLEVRVFNPFRYRGHWASLRSAEFVADHRRLDHRMHNKLMVVDNAAAIIGGRNIGNQYFQMDPESQFADDDVFVVGPIVPRLSATFDDFWNSPLAIPTVALSGEVHGDDSRAAQGDESRHLAALESNGVDYGLALASGEPYTGMLTGRLPLEWAQAEVLSDRPDDSSTGSAAAAGRLLMPAVLDAARATREELLVVTPYFVPTPEELNLFSELRARQVRVRILTNSLESSPTLLAHSGYVPFRAKLLATGVELNEVRSRLSDTRGSGQTRLIAGYGTYALHAKLYVFDRRRLFIGSMNFDQRSKHLNTEVGLLIDSPSLAAQTALRFESMTAPQNSYVLTLRAPTQGTAPRLIWQTREAGSMVEYWTEPARHDWHRLLVRFLSWLPIASEL